MSHLTKQISLTIIQRALLQVYWQRCHQKSCLHFSIYNNKNIVLFDGLLSVSKPPQQSSGNLYYYYRFSYILETVLYLTKLSSHIILILFLISIIIVYVY
uniref:Uncharacterized protein n=1 Tax=Cacopsylla melanoneura TaxID=428564 RepID=A0A8D9E6Q3_9HEMI